MVELINITRFNVAKVDTGSVFFYQEDSIVDVIYPLISNLGHRQLSRVTPDIYIILTAKYHYLC